MQKNRAIAYADRRIRSPEKTLWLAVIERAIIDCLSNECKQSKKDAYNWIFRIPSFSFFRICEVVGADPFKVRLVVRQALESGEVYTQSTFDAKCKYLFE